jgi:hypothetical protein
MLVPMMNVLIAAQPASESLFHHNTVLHAITTIHLDGAITIWPQPARARFGPCKFSWVTVSSPP